MATLPLYIAHCFAPPQTLPRQCVLFHRETTSIIRVIRVLLGIGLTLPVYKQMVVLLLQHEARHFDQPQTRPLSLFRHKTSQKSAHLRRAFEGASQTPLNVTTTPRNEQREGTMNAINCASQLLPGRPVYFASDATFAKHEAKAYAERTNHSVIVFPIHLEFATNKTVSNYYPVFLDLFLMANGRCVSYSKGGYGVWGSLLSSNASCSSSHLRQKCAWKDAD